MYDITNASLHALSAVAGEVAGLLLSRLNLTAAEVSQTLLGGACTSGDELLVEGLLDRLVSIGLAERVPG